MMTALFFLLLPAGRMFSAYCYLPFAGLAIALTGVAEASLWRWCSSRAVAADGYP